MWDEGVELVDAPRRGECRNFWMLGFYVKVRLDQRSTHG